MTDNKINIGDVCTYSFDNENKSLSTVEVVKILSDEVASVKFHQVIVDDSGNGYFTYLCNTGKTMNVSIKYLHKLDLINRLKSENEDLFYKLEGVMHSVDKWLEGDELKQDEVNRAATMREKTLQITEKQQAEIERLENAITKKVCEDCEKLWIDSLLKAEAKAIKEFARELKCGVPQETGVIRCKDVDNLVKEKVGDAE